jgi:hypothetical protein
MQKLVICKSCSKKISKNAKICPHCGEPKQLSKMAQVSFLLIGSGIFLIIGVPFLIFIIAIIGAFLAQ